MIEQAIHVPPKSLTPDRLIKIFQSKGYHPERQKGLHEIRDGIHEAMHVVQSGSKTFNRDKLHEALEQAADRHPLSAGAPTGLRRREAQRMGALLRFELQARAAEMLVCQHFGIEYDLEGWALTTWLETSKSYHVDIGDTETICDSIRVVSEQYETHRLLASVLRMRARKARS